MEMSGILLVFSVIAWPFTTLPEAYFLTLSLLTLVHILSGMALAGVSLALFNIAFKLAPWGNTTNYLPLNGALVSVGMGVGPILGGLCG